MRIHSEILILKEINADDPTKRRKWRDNWLELLYNID